MALSHGLAFSRLNKSPPGNISRAKELYKAASQLDAHNLQALTGTIRCQILSGQYDNAEEQLEILNELQMSMGGGENFRNIVVGNVSAYQQMPGKPAEVAEVAYLSSLLAWNKYKDLLKRRRFLQEASNIQIRLMKDGAPRSVLTALAATQPQSLKYHSKPAVLCRLQS